jgi:hypothetical protein
MIELFSGSGIMSSIFRIHNHTTLTIDNNSSLNPDLCIDILNMSLDDIPPRFRSPDVIWASPPCTAFSVCTISKNFRNGRPISEKAKLGLKLLKKTQDMIKELKPKYFFIENPRGMMRKFNFLGTRQTITYCKYGLAYQKPTDIWTNSTWIGIKPCKAVDRCHQFQPRTYKRKLGYGVMGLGVQGLNSAYDRGKLPPALCEDIVLYCENNNTQTNLGDF